MMCPYCGKEMRKGYLMSSMPISFTMDAPDKLFRIKKQDDMELSKESGMSIPHCAAYHCLDCKKIIVEDGTAEKE